MSQVQSRVTILTSELNQNLKSQNRKAALAKLQQRKKLEVFYERLQSQHFTLEEQLFALEALATQSSTFDTLDQAERASKSMLKDLDQYESLFVRLDDQKAAQDELGQLFKDSVVIDDSQ